MGSRTTVLAVVVVAVALAGGAVLPFAGAIAPIAATGGPADATLADTHSVVEECAAEPPADFADPEAGTADVVGWVEGYWYDEPLDIDVTDGLTESELERLSARTAARFEAIRCLTVQDGLPPVDIVSREEFEEDQSQRFTAIGQEDRLVDNAKFETTLTIDSETDSVDVRQSDTAARVGGFYDFVADEIVIVSDDPQSLSIDESVLAEELGHAIQDQQFDLEGYDRSTVDRDKGILGLIEGDVGFVVHEYMEACDAGEWSEPCLTDEAEGGGGNPDIANWGLYFEEIQPYSDGPSFVQGIKQDGGWEAVNELYADPPTSALHTVYPDTYGEVEPLDVNVSDRSTDEWERVVLETAGNGTLTHDTLGISVIAGMFAAPGSDINTTGSIIQAQSMYNFGPSGEVDQFNPHEYGHPVTEGWRGDSLYTYTNATNETATRWELAWAAPEDVETFVDSYEQLVDIRGGERVDGYAHTYTFDNETGYDIAVTLVPDGDRVTVVTAPTVEALTAIDQELELVAQNADDGDDDSPGDGTDNDGGPDDGDDDGADDGGPDDGTDDGDDDGTDDGGPDDGTGDDGTDDEDGAGDGETEFGILLLTVVGTSLLIVLALLTTGRQRGR